MTAFLVSTETVIRSPEKIFGTDSSPNMSWNVEPGNSLKRKFIPGEVQ